MSNEHRIPPWNTIRVTPPPRVVPPTTGEYVEAHGAGELGVQTTGANNPMLAALGHLHANVVPSGRSRPHRGPRVVYPLVYPPAVQAATGRVLTPLAGLLLAFGVGCAFWALAALLLWWVLS